MRETEKGESEEAKELRFTLFRTNALNLGKLTQGEGVPR